MHMSIDGRDTNDDIPIMKPPRSKLLRVGLRRRSTTAILIHIKPSTAPRSWHSGLSNKASPAAQLIQMAESQGVKVDEKAKVSASQKFAQQFAARPHGRTRRANPASSRDARHVVRQPLSRAV